MLPRFPFNSQDWVILLPWPISSASYDDHRVSEHQPCWLSYYMGISSDSPFSSVCQCEGCELCSSFYLFHVDLVQNFMDSRLVSLIPSSTILLGTLTNSLRSRNYLLLPRWLHSKYPRFIHHECWQELWTFKFLVRVRHPLNTIMCS